MPSGKSPNAVRERTDLARLQPAASGRQPAQTVPRAHASTGLAGLVADVAVSRRGLRSLCGETRYIGRANLAKRLAPLEGSVGRTCYRGGSTRLELGGETLTVTPPFGLGHEGDYERMVVAPLLKALGEEHTVAALLVRLGGYTVGVFEGERLADSKVGCFPAAKSPGVGGPTFAGIRPEGIAFAHDRRPCGLP
jgi:hypothetical protein